MLSQSHLHELLHYDPETGLFTWKFRKDDGTRGIRVFNSKFAGKIASRLNLTTGYREICINHKIYQAHRLAHLYMSGEWPDYQVDHENGVRDDNRWTNLRPATVLENRRNTRTLDSNTSGRKGVSFNKRSRKWIAYLSLKDKSVYLGTFSSFEHACIAREQGERALYGDFANQR